MRLFFFIILFAIPFKPTAEEAFHEKGWYLVGPPSPHLELSKFQADLFEYASKQTNISLLAESEYLYQYKYFKPNLVEVRGICVRIPKQHDIYKDFLLVFDGGNCFFSVKFDIEKSMFYELWINGET